jgi:hypothetical protein
MRTLLEKLAGNSCERRTSDALFWWLRRPLELLGPPAGEDVVGTLILEPGPDRRYRLMMRVRGGIEHVSDPSYDLTPTDALYLLACALQTAMTVWGDDRGTSPDHPKPEPVSAESRSAVSA